MRRKSPKPKLQEVVRIPARLVEFLRYANELIIAEDEVATVPSDDLIQVEESIGWLLASGGLIEAGGSRFSFIFFQNQNKPARLGSLN